MAINKKKSEFFMVFMKAYPRIFKAALKDNLILSTVDIFHGISFAFIILATEYFFNSVSNAGLYNGTLNKVLLMFLLLISAQLISQILNGIINFYSEVVREKAYGELSIQIQNKISKINPIEFEKVERLNDIEKANQGAVEACNLVDTINSIFTFYVPYFSFIAFYMYSLKPILILSIIIVFIPVLISNFIRIPINESIEEKSAPLRREYAAYENSMVSMEFFKETRILGALNYFKTLYKDSIEKLNNNVWIGRKKEVIVELFLNTLSLIAYGGILGMLVYFLLKGEITVGAFAATYASIDTLFLLMDEIVKEGLGSVSKNLGMIKNFINLFDIEECKYSTEKPRNNSIELENIDFTYPNSKKYSLKDISLQINNNEVIAIVGENGAGKSTLAKIILGVYKPTSGKITVGGVDISKYNNKFVFEKISTVCQNFQRFKMTLEDNIRISNYELSEDVTKEIKDISIKFNNKSIDEMKNITLSREFDGIDLSGGQWQRIAIARGIYRRGSIIVLDEPTAAIDPIEESSLYNQFEKMSVDKTTIIITHRLGLTKIADRIIVMKNGFVLEVGTHEQLINNQGEYAKMWNCQSERYV